MGRGAAPSRMAPTAVDAGAHAWKRARHILTLDGSGGLVAGALVLALHAPVARFYGLSEVTVTFVALANLA